MIKDLKDPKFWASVLAWMIVVVIIVVWLVGVYKGWCIAEIGNIIGGLAGPLAGLAGFLYVYATFQQQHHHFKIDQNNQMFFRLLTSLNLIRDRMSYSNPIRNGESNQNRRIDRDFAFKEIKEHLELWANDQNTGWPTLKKEDFDKRGNDYEYVQYPRNFSFENAEKNQIEFLFKAIGNEETLGAYLKSLLNIFRFCQKEELGGHLQILESHMGKHERVFLYYYCSFFLDTELVIYLKANKFLLSVSRKHLIHPNHERFLYEDKSIYQNHNYLDINNIENLD